MRVRHPRLLLVAAALVAPAAPFAVGACSSFDAGPRTGADADVTNDVLALSHGAGQSFSGPDTAVASLELTDEGVELNVWPGDEDDDRHANFVASVAPEAVTTAISNASMVVDWGDAGRVVVDPVDLDETLTTADVPSDRLTVRLGGQVSNGAGASLRLTVTRLCVKLQ